MKITSVSFSLLATAALAGCGASSNSAPIVYGTQPSTTARVYNSPADVYMRPEQQAATQNYAQAYRTETTAPRPMPSQGASQGPAALTPVAQNAYTAAIQETQPVFSPQAQSASYVAPVQTHTAGRSVIVQPGDTVYAIARRTGTNPKAIIAQNNLRAPYSLSIGQRLMLPGSGKLVNTVAASAPSATGSSVHIVRPGDTLYSISRASGVPVGQIARANGLRSPFRLSIGDRLTVPGGQVVSAARPQSAIIAPTPAPVSQPKSRNVSFTQPSGGISASPASLFAWPVKGAVISRYGSGEQGRRNEGVNIAAPVGTPVRAAADGEVVYRGAEVDGFGNLLLIKHDDDFVTAYAHNDVLLVRKGQKVRQGQVIAKVGQSGAAAEPQLHFEIRQNLKSIDPLALLQQ